MKRPKKPWKHWTPADTALAETLCGQGVSMAKIAARLGRSENAVRLRLHRRGVQLTVPWTDEEKQKLRELHAAGLPYAEIAKQVDHTYPSTRQTAWRMGLKKTRGPTPNRHPTDV